MGGGVDCVYRPCVVVAAWGGVTLLRDVFSRMVRQADGNQHVRSKYYWGSTRIPRAGRGGGDGGGACAVSRDVGKKPRDSFVLLIILVCEAG